jgi:hypothetical protein
MANTKCFFKFVNDEVKAKFSQSRCLFTISVGQQTHEGEHFAATIELLNKSFKSCVMLVDDSLQRHTMALSRTESPDYFYKASLEEGDLWLKRNKKHYQKLNNLEKIVRWDTWLNHPKFDEHKKAIKNLINNDPEYAYAFETAIDGFVNKYCSRVANSAHFDVVRAKRLSLEFVVEECAALCLWTELNCQYEAYPNLHNLAINTTRERFVLSRNPNLINAITLGFRNAKQLAPQHFLCLEQNDNHMAKDVIRE